MVPIKNTFYLLSLALLTVSACNKDNDKQTSLAVGKWKVSPTIIRSFVKVALRDSTIQNSDPSDYFDFKANGIAEARGLDRVETFPYSVNGETITKNQTKGKINTLTANTLSYTLPDTISSTHYIKVTWNLYK